MASTLVNSQGEFNFIDYNAAFNLGSGSNISDYDRVIKSAANKYRHMIPSTEAIEEEAENFATKGGMFKRNSNLDDEYGDELKQKSRKTPPSI